MAKRFFLFVGYFWLHSASWRKIFTVLVLQHTWEGMLYSMYAAHFISFIKVL